MEKELLKDRIKNFPHDAYGNYIQCPLKGLKAELELAAKAPNPSAIWPILNVLKQMKLENPDKVIILDSRSRKMIQNRSGKTRETVSRTINFLLKTGYLTSIIMAVDGLTNGAYAGVTDSAMYIMETNLWFLDTYLENSEKS